MIHEIMSYRVFGSFSINFYILLSDLLSRIFVAARISLAAALRSRVFEFRSFNFDSYDSTHNVGGLSAVRYTYSWTLSRCVTAHNRVPPSLASPSATIFFRLEAAASGAPGPMRFLVASGFNDRYN